MNLDIIWMRRVDMPEVMEIERQSFECSWTEEEFLCCLRQRNCIGWVAMHEEHVVGFMIYELLKSQLHVLNFAVSPWARRQSVGTRMIEKLVNKLSQQRRQEITLEVRESNLQAQQFFREMGFTASSIIRGHYQDAEEDAYVMCYQIGHVDEITTPFIPKNRMAEFMEGNV